MLYVFWLTVILLAFDATTVTRFLPDSIVAVSSLPFLPRKESSLYSSVAVATTCGRTGAAAEAKSIIPLMESVTSLRSTSRHPGLVSPIRMSSAWDASISPHAACMALA